MKKNHLFHAVSFLLIAEVREAMTQPVTAGMFKSNQWLFSLKGNHAFLLTQPHFPSTANLFFPTHTHAFQEPLLPLSSRATCAQFLQENVLLFAFLYFHVWAKEMGVQSWSAYRKTSCTSIRGGRKAQHLEVRFNALKNPQHQIGSLRKDPRFPADSPPGANLNAHPPLINPIFPQASSFGKNENLP